MEIKVETVGRNGVARITFTDSNGFYSVELLTAEEQIALAEQMPATQEAIQEWKENAATEERDQNARIAQTGRTAPTAADRGTAKAIIEDITHSQPDPQEWNPADDKMGHQQGCKCPVCRHPDDPRN